MHFPEFNRPEFARYLYQLWPSPDCTLDSEAAATGLGVSPATVRRWLRGKQRVPLTTWQLVWLLGSGELPDRHGWYGWLFTSHWNPNKQRHQHRLVAPNGTEYSPGEILSWHFQYQRIAHLTRENERLRAITSKPPIPNITDIKEKITAAETALTDLSKQIGKYPEEHRNHA